MIFSSAFRKMYLQVTGTYVSVVGLSHLLVANSGPDPGTFLIPDAYPENQPYWSGVYARVEDVPILLLGKRDDSHRILGVFHFSTFTKETASRSAHHSREPHSDLRWSRGAIRWHCECRGPLTAAFGRPFKAPAKHHGSLLSELNAHCWKTCRAYKVPYDTMAFDS